MEVALDEECTDRRKAIILTVERIMSNTSDIGTTGINWRRGAFRLWVLFAVIWLASATWVQTHPAPFNPSDPFADIPSPRSQRGCEEAAKAEPRVIIEKCVARAAEQNWGDVQRVAWVVLPPIGVLILGLGMWWVVSGFRPRRISH
jgi:hypothetical protein